MNNKCYWNIFQKFILLPEGVAPSKSTINASPSNETFQETVNRPSVNKSTLDESTAASHTALPSIKTVEEKVDGPRVNIFANDFNGVSNNACNVLNKVIQLG